MKEYNIANAIFNFLIESIFRFGISIQLLIGTQFISIFTKSNPCENDKIKVTKKGKIKTTKIGYFFDCKKIV